ncbi:uncharacterized protein LOC142973509 [Anticarsia gemmatalis]|uniref:uncharacterized protein LOC142973509 n=1 Tax=Anticarsia gemmatalis TaxID=129554 RepID=UPI003F76B02D
MAATAKLMRLAKVLNGSWTYFKSMQSWNPLRSYSESKGGKEGDKPPALPPKDENPNAPTMYDVRKYSHQLPSNCVCPFFEVLYHIPTGIFRCTVGEMLGSCCAAKCGYYQNPEYFSYHHMSFFDLHLYLRPYRQPSAKSGRKPP